MARDTVRSPVEGDTAVFWYTKLLTKDSAAVSVSAGLAAAVTVATPLTTETVYVTPSIGPTVPLTNGTVVVPNLSTSLEPS